MIERARVVLDAGGLRRLADRSTRSLAVVRALRERDLWPALVPAPVLVEALTGDRDADRPVEELVACCDVVEQVGGDTARRGAWLRTAANRGTAVDALVVALAEPGGTVLVHHRPTIEALALFANGVFVERLS